MIIGSGNVARAIYEMEPSFGDIEDVIFFCSGVSDSSCNSGTEFERERQLLRKYIGAKHLVYFSSLSIYHTKNNYNVHKKAMEQTVRAWFDSYTIFRMEIIEWGRNPTTIHNVFRRKIAAGEPVTIQDTTRYVLSKAEFQKWLALIPVGEKHEMNVPGREYSIVEIYQMVKAGVL